jgi:CRISPR-associated protein Cas1
MGMEGARVRRLYKEMAEKYKVNWDGRSYVPGKFELSDITNKILTACNAALYGLLSSCIYSLGYTPHIGFIHTGSPLPFVYDLADLYKEYLCIDLAFSQTIELAGIYDKYRVSSEFRRRVQTFGLLHRIKDDIDSLFKDL